MKRVMMLVLPTPSQAISSTNSLLIQRLILFYCYKNRETVRCLSETPTSVKTLLQENANLDSNNAPRIDLFE
jgi:hypothetical protein